MSRTCPTCQTTLPESFPGGLCPKCLLTEAVSSNPGQAEDAPVRPHIPDPEALSGMFPELEILELLGVGGMGAVYKARQPRLDRLVALKIMVAPPGKEAGFALRFEREAQVMARLNHPCIVTIHDFGHIDPQRPGEGAVHFILMEHVEGTDLGHLMKSGGMNPELALEIVPQICKALQYAHDRGVTHRDIKPSNILLDCEGGVKVADFGLARLSGDPGEPLMTGLTKTGSSMGTPHYMAPEQWEHPEEVDHRADLYSLGAVLYEMLTGERPAGAFKTPSVKSGVDVRLDKVVMRAMEREPDERYQQASEISDQLTEIGTPIPEEETGWWKGRAPLVLAVVVLIGVLAGLARELRNEGTVVPATARVEEALSDLPEKRQTYSIVMISTDPKAREISPGAPWDVDRKDLIDLQVSHTSTNGYRGGDLDHSVTVALTADGKLLDWINTIPRKSIVPPGLKWAEVEMFHICWESNRSVAMLRNGKVLVWSWELDPEQQAVRVTEPVEIEFGRKERPVKVRSIGFNAVAAIFPDGGIETDWKGFDPLDLRKLEGKAGVSDLYSNYIALLTDGSLVNIARDSIERGPGKLVLPDSPASSLRTAPFLASAILKDGSLWYWNENNSDHSVQLLPVLKKAGGNGHLTDFYGYQSGDGRFAVKNDSGNWYVSHGDLNEDQRKKLKDAAVVFRHEDYVIGLKSVD